MVRGVIIPMMGGPFTEAINKIRLRKRDRKTVRYYIKMLLDIILFDNLTTQAKSSPRLRMNYDLRDLMEGESRQMLNARVSCTVIPIHWQTGTSCARPLFRMAV